jgi:pyruvate,water dikinase
MQYKDGGASLERRIRRINLISEILKKIGFENMSHGDFLHSQIAYCSKEVIKDRLYILGRLTIMTKQLDMALSNDSIAQWYLNDFLTKLGLANGRNKI